VFTERSCDGNALQLVEIVSATRIGSRWRSAAVGIVLESKYGGKFRSIYRIALREVPSADERRAAAWHTDAGKTTILARIGHAACMRN